MGNWKRSHQSQLGDPRVLRSRMLQPDPFDARHIASRRTNGLESLRLCAAWGSRRETRLHVHAHQGRDDLLRARGHRTQIVPENRRNSPETGRTDDGSRPDLRGQRKVVGITQPGSAVCRGCAQREAAARQRRRSLPPRLDPFRSQHDPRSIRYDVQLQCQGPADGRDTLATHQDSTAAQRTSDNVEHQRTVN